MKKTPFYPAESEDTEALVSILNASILFSDIFVSGKETIVGLKYDEENMFVPMIVIIEREAAADILLRFAEEAGVPVVNNIMLAKNLASYGKAGESIPESCFRDVSLAFARFGSGAQKRRQQLPEQRAKHRSIPKLKPERPICLELGESIFMLIAESESEEAFLIKPLADIRKNLLRLLGFSIPGIRFMPNPKLKGDEYRILFKGLEAARGKLDLGWYSLHNAHDDKGIAPSSPCAAPMPETCALVMMNEPANLKAAAEAISAMIIRHVGKVLQRRTPELLGRDEVQAILDTAEEKYPVVTGEVKSFFTLGLIREILQALVSERVSIRHMAIILETLADWAGFGPAPKEIMVEQVRQALKHQICLEYTDDKLTLHVITLDGETEKSVINHAMIDDGDTAALSSSDFERQLTEAVTGALHTIKTKGFPPVILCSPRARVPVREITRKELPDLAVLSYIEVPHDVTVKPVAEVQLRVGA